MDLNRVPRAQRGPEEADSPEAAAAAPRDPSSGRAALPPLPGSGRAAAHP